MGSSFAALTSGQDRRTPEDAYGWDEMPSTDETKGRIKEAAGDLANDKDLQREGKVERAGGEGEGSRRRDERQGQARAEARLTPRWVLQP